METQEIISWLPPTIEEVWPGRTSQLAPGRPAWLLERGDALAVVSVLGNPAYVRIVGGCVVGATTSPDLFWAVNIPNAETQVGRFYYLPGATSGVMNVLYEDNVFVDAVSMAYRPGLQNLISRIATVWESSANVGAELRAEHGGSAFTRNEIDLLLD